jgi:hypothetical protein
MKARVKLIEGVSFAGQSESGHTVVMDGPPDGGGRNLGVRPMEMLLLGLGGCSAYDVVHILRKGRQQVTDCVADLDAERAPSDPKVFTRIHRQVPRPQAGRAGGDAVRREILLGLDHARQGRRDHPRLRNRRSLKLTPLLLPE